MWAPELFYTTKPGRTGATTQYCFKFTTVKPLKVSFVNCLCCLNQDQGLRRRVKSKAATANDLGATPHGIGSFIT